MLNTKKLNIKPLVNLKYKGRPSNLTSLYIYIKIKHIEFITT